jgi:uncharacterized protein YnzC (UPF0291/DUF896 family)
MRRLDMVYKFEYFLDVPYVRFFTWKFTNGKNLLNSKVTPRSINKSKLKSTINLTSTNKKNICKINQLSKIINQIKNVEYSLETKEIIDKNENLSEYMENFRANCKNEYELID